MGRSIVSSGDPKGTGGERKAPSAPAGATPCPGGGLTRRLRRGLGLAVPWGAHTFLSVAKEKCAKESQRHGDSGKKPFIAHFGGGARYVARSTVGLPTLTFVRARSSPFSAVKMGGPFSLRCLSPLCSPAVGVGQAYPLRVGMTPVAWRSCSAEYEGFCFRRSRRRAGLSPTEWDGFMMVGRLCRDKSQQVFEKMWAFAASHEARRRMAVFPIQLTRSHTKPASRGTCRATAVKPSQPACLSTPLRA